MPLRPVNPGAEPRRPGAPSLIDVLRAAGGSAEAVSAIERLSAAQVRWAVETGLGPQLHHLVPEGSPLAGGDAFPLLRGSSLAARIESADQLDAAVEIVDACRGVLPPPTLLKGISVCEREYPAPHLRPMRDIDLLVGRTDVPPVAAVLRRLGYEQEGSAETYRDHHHAAPFVHPRTRVWVEVHHRLFRPDHALGSDPLFDPETVAARLVESTLRGHPVRRLGPEMQVAYVAAHWSASAKLVAGAGGLLPLLDLVYILKGHAVRWPMLLSWLEHSAAAPAAYVLLAYGARRGVISVPDEFLSELRVRQRAFDALTLSVAFAVIDGCMVDGRRRLPLVGGTGLRALWKGLFLPGPPLRNLARVPALFLAARAEGQEPVR